MKKAFAIAITLLATQLAHAGDLHCGANVETEPGSSVYNKNLFWEKSDLSQPKIRFVLADGTLVRPELQTPEELKAKIVDGTKWIGVSKNGERLQLMSGTAYHDAKGELKYKNVALSNAINPTQPMLLANDVVVMCVQQ